MKKLWLSATALVAVAAVPGFASAQGWYGSLNGAYSTDGSIQFDAPANPVTVGASPYSIGENEAGNGGWGAAAALGYAFANGFRAETEIAKQNSEYAKKGVNSTLGDVNTWTAMLNGLYDFNRDAKINPFIGAGVGLARVKATVDSFDHDPAYMNDPTKILSRQSAAGVADTDSAMAWQLIAGLGLKLTDQLTTDLSYKWVNVPDLELAGTGRYRTNATGGSATTPLALGGGIGGGLGSGGILGLGLRYAFAKPAAPAAPEVVTPPPPPVQPTTPVVVAPPTTVVPVTPVAPVRVVCDGESFVVYFEHDKSFLTAEAVAKIDSSVAKVKANACEYKSVLLEGHADLSGNVKYNENLSKKRVTIVHDALVARGVPSELMEGQAYGESKPQTATADGVKEPNNRRTEVTFSFK
jgi:OmpA-OmpF porin, OOP family